MTAKFHNGEVVPGCELENFALSASLAEMRVLHPGAFTILTDLEVTTECNHECERVGECPRLDEHTEDAMDPTALERLELSGKLRFLATLCLTIMLSSCSLLTPLPAEWNTIIENSAETPLTIQEREDEFRIKLNQDQCISGILVTKPETIVVKKKMLCDTSEDALNLLGGMGQLLGGILIGVLYGN